MFSYLSSAINQAIDTVAPPLPPQQELDSIWTNITSIYIEKSKAHLLHGPVEETSIPKYLDSIVDIVHNELNIKRSSSMNGDDDDSDVDHCSECDPHEDTSLNDDSSAGEQEIGPCLEYLLSRKIFETIVALAANDTPAGLFPEVIHFFAKLVGHSRTKLLKHGMIISSVQRLVSLCGKVVTIGLYERSQLYFVSTICSQLEHDPELVTCFAANGFPLINAILALMSTPDAEILHQAQLILTRLLTVLDSNAAKIVAQQTPMCSTIVSHLASEYQSIPISLSSDQIDFAIETVSGNRSMIGPPRGVLSPELRRFLAFYRWWAFIDSIFNQIQHQPILFEALLSQFQSEFYEEHIQTIMNCDLSRQNEDLQGVHLQKVLFTIAVLTMCLRHSTYLLASRLGLWIITAGQSEENESSEHHNQQDENAESPAEDRLRLNRNIIDRCHYQGYLIENPQVKEIELRLSLDCLLLLEEIISKPSLLTLKLLILNDVDTRSYFDFGGANYSDSEEGGLELGPVPNAVDDGPDLEEVVVESVPSSLTSPSPISQSLSTTESAAPLPRKRMTSKAPSRWSSKRLHQMIELFTSLVPDELKSDPKDEGGFESYAHEAQKHFFEHLKVAIHYKDFKRSPGSGSGSSSLWSSSCSSSTQQQYHNRSEPEAEQNVFYEGPFLSALLSNLAQILRNPYALNLQVTCLVSKLALIMDDNLTEYILDPTIPLATSVRSVFAVLHQVVEELQVVAKGIPDLAQKLQMTRRSLLGEQQPPPPHAPVQPPVEKPTSTVPGSSDPMQGDVYADPHRSLLESLIVVEEFCKELAAIAFVKYHHRLTMTT